MKEKAYNFIMNAFCYSVWGTMIVIAFAVGGAIGIGIANLAWWILH
jgi:hypothetical protein